MRFLVLCLIGCGGTTQEIAVVDVPPRAVIVATPSSATVSTEPKPRADIPFAAGQQWEGTYLCAQGNTQLSVRIERVDGYDVRGVFDFEHVQSGASGEYVITGHYDAGRSAINFRPGAWREGPPAGYVSVGLNGTVSGSTFNGTVDGPGCKWFHLSLVSDDIDYD